MLFVVLAVVARRWRDRLRPGDIFAGYLIGYPLGRFWITFFRPDAWMLGPLATAQWIAIVSALAGITYIAWRHRGTGPPSEETPETEVA
jgi:prolipoprotein diacylglyceryltransferase